MEPNVIIEQGKFILIAAVRAGDILLHRDFPLGLAARDMSAGQALEYDPIDHTEDILKRVDEVEVIRGEDANTP